MIKNILRSTCYVLLALGVVHANPSIEIPTAGATLVAGSPFTVMVLDSAYSQPIIEGSLTIGLTPCTEASCPAPDSQILHVLYAGGFNPQRPATPVSYDPGSFAFENFTLSVPANAAAGTYTLGVFHTYWGESASLYYSPASDTDSVTVSVVSA
ncbi:hypothetical protein BDP27DRAFT_1422418 [Rhodocollybia butyracea]|uniref:Uncharacterized protein n=1 Tax=Rhodocollybia butyracea TaxID=206335 RepID=A0A9P5PRR1_9AGAR|nr:hypothetical protein BDP27DRAFT_1422418 [Rhodocollybia butyracea]